MNDILFFLDSNISYRDGQGWNSNRDEERQMMVKMSEGRDWVCYNRKVIRSNKNIRGGFRSPDLKIMRLAL